MARTARRGAWPRCVGWLGWACSAGACNAGAEPRWAVTREICGWVDVPLARANGAYEPATVHPYADESCIAAVLEDFSVDAQAFADAGDLADPDLVLDSDEAWDTRVGSLLGGAWALQGFDLGELGEVEQQSVLAVLEREAPREELRAALYDYAASRIARTVPGDEPALAAHMDPWSHTLAVVRPLAALEMAAALVHEARHADWVIHHRCDAPAGWCDRREDGAYGFEREVHRAAASHAAEEIVASYERDRAMSCTARIETGP